MKRHGRNVSRWLAVMACSLVCALMAGCNEEVVPEDEPLPEGKGSLVLNNLTTDAINIYVGGMQTGTVAAISDAVVYMYPGLYRVVLDQDGGPRNFRDDVDILRGRRTILHIDYNPADTNLYTVVLEFD